jgi:hypothetical protein
MEDDEVCGIAHEIDAADLNPGNIEAGTGLEICDQILPAIRFDQFDLFVAYALAVPDSLECSAVQNEYQTENEGVDKKQFRVPCAMADESVQRTSVMTRN